MNLLPLDSEWERLLNVNDCLPAFAEIMNGWYPTDDEIERFVKCWLREGIPFCFHQHPAAYGRLRDTVAARLSEEPLNVGIVGSGRIGFSLNPSKQLQRFCKNRSDLDLFLVSDRWFRDLLDDYEYGVARSEELSYTLDLKTSENIARNRKTVEGSSWKGTARRGFIDSNMVPFLPKYWQSKSVLIIDRMLDDIKKEVAEPPFDWRMPDRKRLSLRVYRDWDSFFRQSQLSLQKTVEQLSKGEDN
ncbi:MAG: hypothetical protein AAGH82_02510 [Pseudomonadota bacterium]